MAIQIIKFWIVKEGKLGTAHINRYGVAVGFKPSPCINIYNDKTIRVIVPKGQQNYTELFKKGIICATGGFALLFPYSVGSIGLGTGIYSSLVVTSLLIHIDVNPLEIPITSLTNSKEIPIGIETDESVSLYNQVIEHKANETLRKKERNVLRGENFAAQLKAAYPEFKSQYKRWIKAFVKDSSKANQQVIELLKEFDNKGFKYYQTEILKSLEVSTLSKALSDLLHIDK